MATPDRREAIRVSIWFVHEPKDAGANQVLTLSQLES